MTLTEIMFSILSPPWLVAKIPLISLLMGGSLLVYFGTFVHHNILFPIADFVRSKTHARINAATKWDTSKVAKMFSETFSTIIFLLYVYFGAFVLAEYVFTPILYRLRSIILIVVIILFILLSLAINTKIRKKFMGK